MKEKYLDGDRSVKEILRKNKNNNRKIKKEVSRTSFDSSTDTLEDYDEWDFYEDVAFEKFRNGKR
jgi:hypothetical protein